MDARRVFELELERAHLMAIRAVIRQSEQVDPDLVISIENDLAELVAELEAIEDPTLPMARLSDRLGLGPLERDFVWMAVAMVADPRLVTHGHALIGSAARRGLPLSLHAVITELDGSEGRALSLSLTPAHPLRHYRLLEDSEPAASASAVALRASERLVSYLADTDRTDGALMDLGGQLVPTDAPVFDERQQAAMRRLEQGLSAAVPVIVLVEGPEGSGRRTAAATVGSKLGRVLLSIDLRRLPRGAQALDDALAALRRECLLRDAIPVIADIDDLSGTTPDGGSGLRTLSRFIDTLETTAVLTSSRPGMEVNTHHNLLRVDWPVADTATRRALWERALGPSGDALGDDLDRLSLRYRLGPAGIQRATSAAKLIARSSEREILELPDLVAGVRNNIAERLGSLASRIEVDQNWDDLVLSTDTRDQIHALIGRIRHAHTVYEEWGFSQKAARGIGVPALFSGPPGTGKTMVAGIIARELDLELLQVDLSQVVSKWIGETEKQLSKVFDAAEAGHALLLFDEADALFAKRTEVKGATDRYANLEVNYLLQRVESFGGITILTTNLEASIDKALKRRLAGHIVFWPPDEDEREELWRRLLSTGAAPLADDLDFEDLARNYADMTGANIRNAALSAAFLAASEDGTITHEHLDRAARGEYRTMGRVLR